MRLIDVEPINTKFCRIHCRFGDLSLPFSFENSSWLRQIPSFRSCRWENGEALHKAYLVTFLEKYFTLCRLLWNKEPCFPLNGILLCEPDSSAAECLMTSIFFKNGRRGKCLPPLPEYLRYDREGEDNSSVAEIFLSYFLFVIKKKKKKLLLLLTNNSVRPLITGSTSSAIEQAPGSL